EQEVASLLASVPGRSAGDRRDLALLELLYATGARISEAVGLSVDDIAGSVARLGGPRARAVPYGGAAARALETWLAPGGRPVMTGAGRRHAPPDDAALFVNARGGRLSRQWGWAIVKDRARHAGLQGHLGPHVLRHSFAAHLAARGAPVAVVQQLLNGHPAILDPASLADAYARWHPRT
ncbi:MAG: tyrosine-type recombinase/integrase, partial [Actinomycetota bacterium]|nr:tyrosine-type recombinase/integrase [Actinomycetota bacterium]